MIESMPGERSFLILIQREYQSFLTAPGQPVYMVSCERPASRYDIKGCEVSRWTEPAPEGSQIIVVLKDLNFEGQYINLGKERECILICYFTVAL